MVAENPTWGAPRIHGELKMLGFDISESSVLRWMRKAPRNPEPERCWKAFLQNHREAIAAMDFLTVPTLIFDCGANFNEEVVGTMENLGVTPKRTSFRSPWQNGVAERWVGNCRRDLLDHVIVLNEAHLRGLMSEYSRYYHKDQTHLGLKKETPAGRITAKNSDVSGRVISTLRLGGLHHRHDLAA